MNNRIEADRKYRIMTLLQRADRPSYFIFHCPFCGQRLAEILNADVMALNDVIDMRSTDNVGVGMRCEGQIMGVPCRTYVYFKLM